ncbi:acyloxyacyl hydrolase [Shimia marina]|uniref:Lipid A 3-O-deacylase (PagL) n=1 Tax=Shimia marina TaxID=321267 RepID=A0A0N7LRG2_9RHOB|nr:acyloxyacyl hydrolase [Shimia marina]CUH50732.1 Lipid A 3-O-deacylase (PagL) [Shimia marina]SFE35601.1 Lipid A 3-O-deacylase (PagL) [Shimia marina]
MRKLLYAFLLSGNALQAQHWVLGAGYADFADAQAEDAGMISVEYHARPFVTRQRFSLAWGGALTLFETQDAHVGAGLVGRYQMGQRWFLEGSVMPGLFAHDKPRNDLGSEFEIRSLLAIGRRLKNGSSLSLALSHISNASTASRNPGLDALSLRWTMPLGR